ncbi:helix-turn-helix domain-containing protein [Streptomyces sp. NBC_01356]|uniref:helix-turn-helix transcriptional regulator n=1 Tax=Streptomyces sp. NBC_01356 TaxID=2903836 RepID=UPI002E341600|nr:helix-turn-helix transcriptional regulator [Streptomyces sp. NBC_01356]
MPSYEPPHDLPEHVLSDPELIQACAERDFAAVFQLLKRRAGIYPALIARRCDLTPSRVGEILSGRRVVKDIAVIERIADGLHIPGRMLGLAQRAWERPGPRREPASPAPTPTALGYVIHGQQEAHDHAAVDSFRLADRQLGGGHLYGSVLHYLHNEMAPRLFGSMPEGNVPQTFQAAAALTEMAGWMAHDSGRNDRARDHFTKALRLATVGENPPLGANIMASMSHLALQTGRLEEAATLAKEGREHLAGGPRLPTLSARLHAMEARALARLGKEDSTRRSLALAQENLARDPERPASNWISSFDAAALTSEAALSFKDLGSLRDAQEAAEKAIALRSGDRARSRVFGQITLAMIRTEQGELDAACAVGHELLSACGTLGSLRITQQLDELANSLAPHRSDHTVGDFLDCLTAVNHQRALLLAGISASHGGGAST